MANIVERTFESIVPRLKSTPPPSWPPLADSDYREGDYDPISRSVDSPDDGVYTFEENAVIDGTFDRMMNDRVVGISDNEDREIFGGGIRHHGMEALAFYKSRRFLTQRPYPGRWGIFYLRQGLSFIESEIKATYPGHGNPRKLAVEFLRRHERFHFFADLQTLLFEALIGQQLYEPVRLALKGRASHFVEEALANRNAWDWARKHEVGLEEFAYNFFTVQPNAYSRFEEDRLDLAAEWASVMIDHQPPLTSRRDDLAPWVEATPKSFTRATLCPEYFVIPANIDRWITPASRISPVSLVKDGPVVSKLLEGRFSGLRAAWEDTKTKLTQNRLAGGLDFKRWPQDGKDCFAVRVDRKNRAHLRHIGNGLWEAYNIGPHTAMGHG
jgi:hypothetical protein